MRKIDCLNIAEGYYLDDEYKIISDRGNDGVRRILKPNIDTWGYRAIKLDCIDGVRRSFLEHRIIATLFISNPNKLSIVHHINGDKVNNHPSNLKWVTVGENTKEGYLQKDYHYTRAVLVYYKKELIKRFSSLQECASFYNCDYATIHRNIKIAKITTRGKLANLFFEYESIR